ncbi:MAG: hypothetical protein DRN12_08275 [Thermoplasmata archaeon]|nr:MAG: hypothetical protein DRN12_08275 [Thermoplasmata archaeon]
MKYVLLFGSIRDIPTCYCWNNDNFSDYPEPYFISDLYYADIYDSKGDFSSWDTDNDGIYGEWNGRKAEDYNISLKPEISIGRLACKSRIEAKTVVKKIIEYENNKEKEWFKRITLVGGDELSNITGHYGKKYRAHEGELLCDKVANIMNDFENIKLYVSKNNLDPHGINVVKNINKGCGFLYIPSHGNPMSLATYGDNGSSKITILSTCYSPLLVNQEKLPIAILGGCHSNQIDVTPFNILWGLIKEGWKYFHLPTEEDETFGDFWKYEWVPECIGWRLISNPHGGAIATIGCTGLGWKGIEINREDGLSDWLEIQFFREYKNGTRILGDIWRNCITKYLETFPINWSASSGSVSCLDAKTVEEWILLGDPTLEIG